MSADNLKLWESVEKTNPDYTKTGKVDGRQQTSITPMYLIKEATKHFGKIGEGWGYEVIADRFDQGAPELDQETKAVLYHNVMHTIYLRLWYMSDGQERSIYQYGHTPFIRKSKYGAMTDYEAPKKSLTDAMKKCLSMLGFGADIFMGLYEDQQYVAELEYQAAIEKAEDKDKEAAEQKQAFLDEIEKLVIQMKESKTMGMLNGLYKSAVRKAELRQAKGIIIKLENLHNEMKEQIEGNSNG